MNIKKALTPKDVEEVKPGFYVQKRRGKYRKVLPIVIDGKWLWKEQLRSVFCLRTVVTIAIIIFLVWSYLYDTGAYREFYEEVMENPTEFCEWVNTNMEDGGSPFILQVGDGINRTPVQP